MIREFYFAYKQVLKLSSRNEEGTYLINVLKSNGATGNMDLDLALNKSCTG